MSSQLMILTTGWTVCNQRSSTFRSGFEALILSAIICVYLRVSAVSFAFLIKLPYRQLEEERIRVHPRPTSVLEGFSEVIQ